MPLSPPQLYTARLLLRGFTQADTDAVFALHSNKHVLRYWDSPPWRERAQAERFITRCEAIAQEAGGVRLALERVADRRFIGWCCLNSWNHDFHNAALGYCLTEEAWGQGFATEAAMALLDWGFPALDLIRVQAETDTRNKASCRVLEKLGFVREGWLRQNCIVEGEVSDSFIFGLLRREWRVPRPAPQPG